jgi:hypothetical protein
MGVYMFRCSLAFTGPFTVFKMLNGLLPEDQRGWAEGRSRAKATGRHLESPRRMGEPSTAKHIPVPNE